MAEYFYSNLMELPGRREIGENTISFYDQPAHLAIGLVPFGVDPDLAGQFAGVQLNVVPADGLDKYVQSARDAALEIPDPRQHDDVRVTSIPDSSGNSIMLIGADERPAEPTIDEAVGSVSVFVEDLERARTFYVDQLGFAVRAEPHPGLLVLGESGTALMLYQVEPDNPTTPIGIRTGITLADPDPAAVLSRVTDSDERVIDQVDGPAGEDGSSPVIAATLSDPDGNLLTLLSESHLA